MSEWVLDASAVLALLQAEPGADRVAAVVESAVLSAVNWAEVVSKLTVNGMTHAAAVATTDALPVAVPPFSREHAALASALAPAVKQFGLSLADRACLALGLARGVPVLTADRAWARVDAEVGVSVEVIR